MHIFVSKQSFFLARHPMRSAKSLVGSQSVTSVVLDLVVFCLKIVGSWHEHTNDILSVCECSLRS